MSRQALAPGEGLYPSPGATPRIVLDGVSKTFGEAKAGVAALHDISLSVADGEFISLIGPSGCGKTTVLRILDGLIIPDSGTVLVSGAPPVPGPRIGFVFQSFRLIPWATVRANIDFALSAAHLSPEERAERARRYIDLVGLSKFADAYPRELSGGMNQRVALARALACEPDILLMDEPFASIDAQTRELMQVELARIWALRRPVVMFVTHSVDEAIVLSDRIVLMGPRPGRVLEVLDVDLPRPRWSYDIRAEPGYLELRNHLWQRIREMVLSDPASDFYGRDLDRPGEKGVSV